jgi:hypothetical protein
MSKSISMPRCPTSTCPNRFRCFDAPHRHVQIDFDASMPHIDTSKSISMLRCATSICPIRFRCLDAPHRHVQIDFDASMCHIDMSNSISMPRCPTSTRPNRFRCFVSAIVGCAQRNNWKKQAMQIKDLKRCFWMGWLRTASAYRPRAWHPRSLPLMFGIASAIFRCSFETKGNGVFPRRAHSHPFLRTIPDGAASSPITGRNSHAMQTKDLQELFLERGGAKRRGGSQKVA